jgi:hypothetical protein
MSDGDITLGSRSRATEKSCPNVGGIHKRGRTKSADRSRADRRPDGIKASHHVATAAETQRASGKPGAMDARR